MGATSCSVAAKRVLFRGFVRKKQNDQKFTCSVEWALPSYHRMRNSAKIILGLVAVAAVGLGWIRFRSTPADKSAPAPEPAPIASPAAAESPKVVSPTAAAGENLALKNRLADEIRARQRAEAEAAGLRAAAEAAKTNVPNPIVRAQQIGMQAGTFLPAMLELEALAKKGAASSPEEKRRLLQLQRDHAQLLGALPEITRFQDSPEQYGNFFRSMFQQAAGLNDAQAAQVQEFMQQRALQMNQQQLNTANEPADPKLEEEWEERRDKFNEQTATGLKGILPPGAAEKVNFGPELMEFLEMDFDKLTPPSSEK